ncbi:MAG: hypothetical protein KGR26_00335 [Cyanobacteria bacterium REEB65]|nr:hypothetical protein [Cyanobacteria bacterium REEB65]
MTCETIKTPEGHAIVCGPNRTRTICDVCDKTVPKKKSPVRWRGVKIDLCKGCEDRLRDPVESEFHAFAVKVVATHYPEFPTS